MYNKYLSAHHLFFVIISTVILLLSLVLPNEWLKSHLHHIYLLHFISVATVIPFVKHKNAYIFSPSFLTIIYTYITYILGAWAFNNEIILWTRNLAAFKEWNYVQISSSFTIISLTLIHFSYFFISKKNIYNSYSSIPLPQNKVIILTIIAFLTFLTFSILDFDVGIFGGVGNYDTVPITLAALLLIMLLCLKQVNNRYFYYFLILLTFASFSAESKREAIFLFLVIGFAESIFSARLKITLKKTLILILILGMAVYFILAMSVIRGYGNKPVDSFFPALAAVPQYIASDKFLASFFQNIETNISFFHSHQAFEYIEEDPSRLMGGESLIKFLFVPIPRTVIEKPTSIVESYTSTYDYDAYHVNLVSWPINFISELYWNFRYFGFIFIIPIFIFLNFIYLKLYEYLKSNKIFFSLILLYMYQYFIFFVRGSGTDLYFLYLILSIFFTIIFFILPYSIFKSLSLKAQ